MGAAASTSAKSKASAETTGGASSASAESKTSVETTGGASQDITQDLIDQISNSDPGTASQLQEVKDAIEGSGLSEGGRQDATISPPPTFNDPPADPDGTMIPPSTSAKSKASAETTGGASSASAKSEASAETTGGASSAIAKSEASAETTGGAASADSEAKVNANTGATTTTTTSAPSTTTSTTNNQQSEANGITGEQITTLTEKVGEVAEKMEKLQEEMRLQMEEQASKKTYSRRKRQTVSCSSLINLMQKLAALRIETEGLVASQNFEELTLPNDVRAQLEEFKKYHQLILQGIYTEEESMSARYSASCGAGTGIGARMLTADQTDQTTSMEGRVEANDEASVETNAKANAEANVEANAEANVDAVVETSAEANAKTTTGDANDPPAKTELKISGTGNRTKTARRVTKDRVVDQTVSIKTSGENGTTATASATAFVKDDQRPNKG